MPRAGGLVDARAGVLDDDLRVRLAREAELTGLRGRDALGANREGSGAWHRVAALKHRFMSAWWRSTPLPLSPRPFSTCDSTAMPPLNARRTNSTTSAHTADKSTGPCPCDSLRANATSRGVSDPARLTAISRSRKHSRALGSSMSGMRAK